MKFITLSALFISSVFSAAINNGAAINNAGLEARDPGYPKCYCVGFMSNGNYVAAIVNNGRGYVRSGNVPVFHEDGFEITGSSCQVSWTRADYCKNWTAGSSLSTGRNCDGKRFQSVKCTNLDL
ncbi:uncharacterized protein RSE6_16159 [Rhynchosporium secalis]|uniref:Uncharacterized protein n=1 Tax=Rhynchosporium secalis TaxID=38038 RepID=A0A1E1LYQ6_RHYSE|nr:uncharacterized protein RSE6_16159 [Rhynchosporium secalis]